MKRMRRFLSVLTFLFLGICMSSLGIPTLSLAAHFTVDEATDLHFVGDFIVAGVDGSLPSPPGQVYDVLQLQNDGSESGSATHLMGDLHSYLANQGISSAYGLVFGFGLNENDPSNSVTIQELEMTFAIPNGDTTTYTLDGHTVDVFASQQGQSNAEAQFQVSFDDDFMSLDSSSLMENFFISSTIDGTSDGFEIFFLSAVFTANPPTDPGNGGDNPGNGGSNPGDGGYDDPFGGGPGSAPVPEPATMLLLGSGLLGLASFRKKTLRAF